MRHHALATALISSFLVLSCGGGGGGSPSAPPPPVLRVAGTWEGIWVPPVTVSLRLDQAQGSREVTGTISALGVTLPLRGETNLESPGRGTFNWEVTEPGCGSWTGNMQVTAPDSMNGPSRLSTLGCSDPDVIEGRMFLSRAGSASQAVDSTPVTGEQMLEGLIRALQRAQ